MSNKTYTPELVAEGGQLFDLIGSTPRDKQVIAAIIAETFINGMAAQERLAAAERDSA